ncbi:MAG: hypothetical protein J0H94_05495 [Rhizobiales bacterium]|nr:hypothetical protein [Hyphomicrobiales bacterium]
MAALDFAAFRNSLDAPEPVAALSPPLTALWWLAKGGLETGPGWEKAHEIAQSSEGEPAHDWVHALVHRIEGDHGNAAYWYRRAGKPTFLGTLDEEWQVMTKELLGAG